MTSDGRVYCWGNDGSGQLGNGPTGGSMAVPYPVDVTDVTGDDRFIQLARGLEHVCGLTGEGVVYCWGRNAYGQIGAGAEDPNYQLPTPVYLGWVADEKSFVYIAADGDHSCAVTGEGLFRLAVPKPFK